MSANENKQVLVNCKVDEGVKNCADATLSNMGLNLSSYINLCLRQVCSEKKLPFVPSYDVDFWAIEKGINNVISMISVELLDNLWNLRFKHLMDIQPVAQKYLEYLCLSAVDSRTIKEVKSTTEIPIKYFNKFIGWVMFLSLEKEIKYLIIKDINDIKKREEIDKEIDKLLKNFLENVKNNKVICDKFAINPNTSDKEIVYKISKFDSALYNCYKDHKNRLSLRISEQKLWEILEIYCKNYENVVEKGGEKNE